VSRSEFVFPFDWNLSQPEDSKKPWNIPETQDMPENDQQNL
jgi:hypothetical protein